MLQAPEFPTPDFTMIYGAIQQGIYALGIAAFVLVFAWLFVDRVRSDQQSKTKRPLDMRH